MIVATRSLLIAEGTIAAWFAGTSGRARVEVAHSSLTRSRSLGDEPNERSGAYYGYQYAEVYTNDQD